MSVLSILILAVLAVGTFVVIVGVAVEEWRATQRPRLCESCMKRAATHRTRVFGRVFLICDRCKP